MGIEKYYTPELEELHFGFECEVYNSTERYMFEAENGWIKTCIGIVNELRFMPTILSLINDSQIRVKYLDREDIEECGWESQMVVNVFDDEDDIISGYVISKGDKEEYVLLHNDENGAVGIYTKRIYSLITDNWEQLTLFSGYIKNKSEFKKLMKQLNICTK